MPKTYFREFASGAFLFNLALFGWEALGHVAAARPADALLPYTFALVGAAFGLKTYAAQILPQKLGKGG